MTRNEAIKKIETLLAVVKELPEDQWIIGLYFSGTSTQPKIQFGSSNFAAAVLPSESVSVSPRNDVTCETHEVMRNGVRLMSIFDKQAAHV